AGRGPHHLCPGRRGGLAGSGSDPPFPQRNRGAHRPPPGGAKAGGRVGHGLSPDRLDGIASKGSACVGCELPDPQRTPLSAATVLAGQQFGRAWRALPVLSLFSPADGPATTTGLCIGEMVATKARGVAPALGLGATSKQPGALKPQLQLASLGKLTRRRASEALAQGGMAMVTDQSVAAASPRQGLLRICRAVGPDDRWPKH